MISTDAGENKSYNLYIMSHTAGTDDWTREVVLPVSTAVSYYIITTDVFNLRAESTPLVYTTPAAPVVTTTTTTVATTTAANTTTTEPTTPVGTPGFGLVIGFLALAGIGAVILFRKRK